MGGGALTFKGAFLLADSVCGNTWSALESVAFSATRTLSMLRLRSYVAQSDGAAPTLYLSGPNNVHVTAHDTSVVLSSGELWFVLGMIRAGGRLPCVDLGSLTAMVVMVLFMPCALQCGPTAAR